MSEIKGSIEIRNNIKNACPVCGMIPEIVTTETGTRIECRGHVEVYYSGEIFHFFVAMKRWNKICRNWKTEEVSDE